MSYTDCTCLEQFHPPPRLLLSLIFEFEKERIAMAASVLGKRQRGALQTEGTSESRLSHDGLLTAL